MKIVKKETINIAYCFDNLSTSNYYKYCVTTICQMISKFSHKNNYHIYILTNKEFGLNLKQYILKGVKNIDNVEITQLTVDQSKLNGRNCRLQWTIGAYFRLFLPTLLKNVDKILYFDCDAFFNTDVKKMWDCFDNKYHIQGFFDTATLEPDFKDYFAHSKIDFVNKRCYVCSGIIIMNLKKIRDDGLASKLIKQANIGNNIQHDQTVLNETCKCGLLPQEFGAPVEWKNGWYWPRFKNPLPSFILSGYKIPTFFHHKISIIHWVHLWEPINGKYARKQKKVWWKLYHKIFNEYPSKK